MTETATSLPASSAPDTVRNSAAIHDVGSSIAITQRLSYNNFDLLRLLLAATVVVYHTGILSQQPSLSLLSILMSGDLGVQGFYVVSGFLVTMSYDRSRTAWSYAAKRARRIAPAYLTVVLGAAVLLAAMSRLSWSEYFLHPMWRSYVFWNVLLANFMAPDLPEVFLGNYKQAVNGSLWTIKIEVGFYCMVPLMAWFARHAGRSRIWWIMLTASLAWRIGFEMLSVMMGTPFWSKLAIQMPGQLSFFILGAIAYERTRLGQQGPTLAVAIAGAIAYGLSDGWLHELIAPFAVASMIYWAAISCPKLPDLSRHGDLSYGIYLYHWPILQVFIAHGWFNAAPYVATAAFFVTVAMVAWASWSLIERRFLMHRHAHAVASSEASR